jgi:elongation factor Ts
MINPKLISELREQTGAGIVECKNALEETGGNIEKAVEILRKKGEIKAMKKITEREAKEGLVHAYIHANGKVGAMVEVNCETDFVARNEEFKSLVHDLAMQIAATNPLYLRPEDIPQDIIEKEKEMYLEEIRGQEKPPSVVEKIIQGKLEKYFEDVCLLKQPFIKDEDITVEELINQKIAKIGEKIEVRRFVRFQI